MNKQTKKILDKSNNTDVEELDRRLSALESEDDRLVALVEWARENPEFMAVTSLKAAFELEELKKDQDDTTIGGGWSVHSYETKSR